MKKMLITLFLLVPTTVYATPFLPDGQYTFSGNLTVEESLFSLLPGLEDGAFYEGVIELRTPFMGTTQITTIHIKSGEYNFNLWGFTSSNDWRAIRSAINGPTINSVINNNFEFAMSDGTFSIDFFQPKAHILGTATPFIPKGTSVAVPEPTTWVLLSMGVLIVLGYKFYGSHLYKQ